MDKPQMQGMPAEEQAKKAIGHLLRIIREHEYVGWYLGWGTQSYSLLTEAYATLTGQDLNAVSEQFEPIRASNPREEGV